jgi:hypothetical protein
MDGWSELGAVMGGGGQLRQQALQMGMDQGARQADMLEQARQRRDQNLGLSQITPESIAAAQADPTGMAGATLMSALLHGNKNPNELATAQKTQQATGFSKDAMTAALDPSSSLDSLNRRMIVIGGKPVDLSKVADGVSYDPMQTPGAQTINPTQIGLADMMFKGAQANASNAQAGADAARARESDAHTSLYNTQTAAGGFNPHTGSDGKDALPPISSLGAVLGQSYDKATGQVSIPPAKMQQFLAWKAQKSATDPRYKNGAYALEHYASEAPIGTGINDSPAAIGATSLTDMLGGAGGKPAIAPPADPIAAPAPTLQATGKAPAKNADGAYTPASKAEFDALPSGALFVNPADGQLRRKH